ncbi:GNAT family N-acetyltransferase [Rheinheimera sp. MM224]|uniref:GNAT family N-acetyltransferase n=1 Tax=Rheinheimera sp. MM224 TaxID=3019969 RepID=UPI0021F8552C|nr:GNAT family N-acetyltransferase [Rheinheimera sp. MM224]CAI3801257.1 Acetyltransferase [Rheinheimera sp. MM224]
MSMKAVLETPRLILRAFTLDDVDAMYQLMTVPEVIRYVGNKPAQSKQDTLDYLMQHPLRDYQVYGYGRFACVWKETGQVIGFSGIKFLEEISETELGYRFLPEFWGKGLATEAGKAVIQFAQGLSLTRLVAVIHPDNEGSQQVATKLGFALEGKTELSLIENQDLLLFSRTI